MDSGHSAVGDGLPFRAVRIGDRELLELPQFPVMAAGIAARFHINAPDSAGRTADEMSAAELDAARYRFLRELDWFSGPLCVLRDPKKVLTRPANLGADCPSRERLDAAIDAAMCQDADTEPARSNDLNPAA